MTNLKSFFVAGVSVGLLMTGTAKADERLDRILMAYYAGDIPATQQDFNRDKPREMAEMAMVAEQSKTLHILVVKEVMPKLMAAKVERNGTDEIWMFEECKDNKQFCGFYHKEYARFGGMEYGQAADIASTVIGLGMGLAEGNPMGLVGAGLIKGGFLINNRIADYQTCVDQRAGLDMAGFGPAAANLLTMAGAPFGVSLAAIPLVMYMRYDKAIEGATFECAGFALDAKSGA